MNEPRIIQIRRQILKENDVLALGLRERFHKAAVYVISIVSGPGSGKTALLARLLSTLSRQQRVQRSSEILQPKMTPLALLVPALP